MERARERIVSAARLAGSEEPSGMIVLLRDGSGTLTLRKVGVEIPESVDARLNGYLTPLVMEHMAEPPASMILELRPDDTRGEPHPDSTSRPPAVENVESLRARLDSMTQMLSELPLQEREPLRGRDTVRILYEALVDSHGQVRHVEVHESSGLAWVDDYFAQLIPRLEVSPRVSFGIREASRLLQPLELVVRGAREESGGGPDR